MPSRPIRNFVKVPPNLSAGLRILALVCQVFVKRKTRIGSDEYLGHHRERHVVFAPAELLDLRI